MSLLGRRVVRAFTRTGAETSPESDDPRLLGRTYAVPFETVWQAALRLAGGLPGWRIRSSDDLAGIINAEAKSRIRRRVSDVKIRISLDPNAQTRIDARSASREGRADLGANARRLHSFFRGLDEAVVGRRRPGSAATRS
jgi:uncharacterized protein (DUF1499 family)